MAQQTIAAPQERQLGLPQRLVQLVPGIVLMFVLGYLGKLAEQGLREFGRANSLSLPNVEYVLWAIIFGLIIANTVGVPRVFQPGIDTYDFWLKTGIVLLGARWAFLLTFAGVGLRTDFRELRRQGLRPFIVGALAELAVTVVTLLLVLAAASLFGL